MGLSDAISKLLQVAPDIDPEDRGGNDDGTRASNGTWRGETPSLDRHTPTDDSNRHVLGQNPKFERYSPHTRSDRRVRSSTRKRETYIDDDVQKLITIMYLDTERSATRSYHRAPWRRQKTRTRVCRVVAAHGRLQDAAIYQTLRVDRA